MPDFLVLFYPYLFRNQTKNQQVVFVYNRVFLVIVLPFGKFHDYHSFFLFYTESNDNCWFVQNLCVFIFLSNIIQNLWILIRSCWTYANSSMWWWKVYLDCLSRKIKACFKEFEIEISLDKYLNAVSFLEQHNQNPYDVVFLDILMPEMNGLDVANRIRNLSEKQ